VPEVLLSGNHEKVREWRLERSRERAKAFAEQERTAAPDTE
jgi:tRNA G37 N-methylase TrmD